MNCSGTYTEVINTIQTHLNSIHSCILIGEKYCFKKNVIEMLQPSPQQSIVYCKACS